ncbi:MAG: glycosyltransferase family 4 protein [Mycobacteriales bacterium]
MAKPAEGRAPRVWLACDWFVKYTAGLARGLADAGCPVTLLTRDHDQEFGDDPGAMRAFIDDTVDGAARHLELGGRVRSLSAVPDVLRLRSARRRWRSDVVHLQDSVANDVRLLAASGALLGRYALTVHDPVPHPGESSPSRPKQIMWRTLRRRASLVFVHSQALREELVATGDVSAPIVVVQHGAGEAARAPLPADESLLFFGRMSYYKGLDVLLDAMSLIWDERPQVTLTVAGEGEIQPHEALDDPRVSVRAEHVPEGDLASLFAAATCVVLPYRQASQSGVGSLARQHGRAVIATAVGGLPELVGDDWGRLVAPENPRALADAVLEVLRTPGLAEEMGRSAAATMADEIGWRTVAERTLDAYRRHLLRTPA